MTVQPEIKLSILLIGKGIHHHLCTQKPLNILMTWKDKKDPKTFFHFTGGRSLLWWRRITNLKRLTSNIQHPTSNIQHPTSNILVLSINYISRIRKRKKNVCFLLSKEVKTVINFSWRHLGKQWFKQFYWVFENTLNADGRTFA